MATDNANVTAKSKDGRFRAWTLVLYDDSAPSNWRDILDELHIPWLESPLHEFDVNPDGEVKKAHRHLLLYFQGKKPYSFVKEICDSLNQPRPEPVADVRGMVRYFIHRDNPDKYQYPLSDLVSHCGFDFSDYFVASKTERYALIAEMLDFIEEKHITEFYVFSKYCRESRSSDWWPLLCDNSVLIVREQIKSIRYGDLRR